MWSKYVDLEPYRRLPNDGRELLGKFINITEKRDGENVSVWMGEDGVHISSRNMINADDDIKRRIMATPEWDKILELLSDEKDTWSNDVILYGELLKTVSPTRIEPKRKHIHWVMFDIYSITDEKWMNYTEVYQRGYHFKIPVTKLLGIENVKTMTELDDVIKKYLKYCKRHRREGIVGKVYGKESIFFKEKIDLPDKPRLERPNTNEIEYPAMPEDKVFRALQHAFDELGRSEELWKDKSKSMPVIAKHIATEAREHNYAPPKNFYSYYISTPLEIVRGDKIEQL